MIVVIMLFIILSLSFGIKIKLKIAQEEAIFIAVFGTTLFAYILGLLNLLNLSVYAIAICSLASIIYTIVKLVKKEENIKSLITLPTVIYAIIMCFIYYIVRNIKFGSEYDEFMFWGTNLKQMVGKDCLWASSKIDGIHLVYPPFTAVAEYIFCKFNGGFNEGVTYFGLISLILATIMPLFKQEKYSIKSFLKIIITIIITYVAIVLFRYNIANLEVDCILGITFAVAMYLAYSLEEKKDYIVLIILLISITLIKTNGILLAGIVIMQLFFKEIFLIIKSKENNKKNIAKRFLIIGVLLLSIILTYLTWKIYYTANGKQIDDRHDKNYVENIDIKEFINALLLKDEADVRNKQIVERYVSAIKQNRIIRKADFNTTFWVYIIINILSIIYFIICKDKMKVFSNYLSINIGFVLYMLTNLLMFMFVFQAYQGEVIMGFERYTRNLPIGNGS